MTAAPIPGTTTDTQAPPRVCLLIADLDSQGGLQMQSRRLIDGIAARGGTVVVCTRNYHALAPIERAGGLILRRTPVAAPPDARSLTKYPPVLSRSTVSSLAYLTIGLVWCFRFRHEYDVIHCQQMFGAALLGSLLKRLTGKPLLVRVTSTGPLGEVSRIRSMPFSGWRLARLRAVDRWVALTEDMSRELQTLGVERERITVIPNSAPIPEQTARDGTVRAAARASLGITASKVAVYSGRLSREKGVSVLVEAWKKVRAEHADAHLYLLGSGGAFGTAEGELRALAGDLGLASSVTFAGHVDNVLEYLLAADVFVMPSPAEGMSNALVEAMAAGVAIVATDIPAHEGLLEDGRTALLVPVQDAGSLGRAVSVVLASPELRQGLAEAVRVRAERDLSVEAMVSAYGRAYRVMQEARSQGAAPKII